MDVTKGKVRHSLLEPAKRGRMSKTDSPEVLDARGLGRSRSWTPSGDAVIDVRGNLRVDSGEALRSAALNGMGIVLRPSIVVAGDLTAARLVRLLEGHAAPRLTLHLLMLLDRHPTSKLRSFIDHVVVAFAGALSPAAKATADVRA